MLKCGQVYERLAAAGVAVRQAWQQSTYGSRPSHEDIAEAGNLCPICQVGRQAGVGVFNPKFLQLCTGCAGTKVVK